MHQPLNFELFWAVREAPPRVITCSYEYAL